MIVCQRTLLKTRVTFALFCFLVLVGTCTDAEKQGNSKSTKDASAPNNWFDWRWINKVSKTLFGSPEDKPRSAKHKTTKTVLDTTRKSIYICSSLINSTGFAETLPGDSELKTAVVDVFRQIYCSGPILHAVQKANLFADSKHFVDMALKKDPVLVLKDFYDLQRLVGDLSKDAHLLREFVDSHFLPPGTELEECDPDDWSEEPASFDRIHNYHFRRWAKELNKYWRQLCRQVKSEVAERPELYSMLYVPFPFIIPGGRFREYYYWDSYWIVKGLLFSEMYNTAKGVILNFVSLVHNYGFVPNGGRVYYMMRSHPPLLIPMVYEYYMATGDIELVNEVLPALEKEYDFWLDNRGLPFEVAGQSLFNLFQYKSNMRIPRPESYREDMELVHNVSSIVERELIWSQVASAAETGWDFSSRWFAQAGPFAHKMSSIRTHSIIPVDLNSFMCMNTRILAHLFELAHNMSRALVYNARFQQAKRAMQQIHWNETDGMWYDYDLDERKHVRQYYASNTLPIFASCYDDDMQPRRAFEYLRQQGVFNFTRGVPTSLIYHSEQQWDASNAWPPMVHMLIVGFWETGDAELMEAARKVATQWLRANYKAYIKSHAMYEKYNVTEGALFAGSGGEYEVQTGFGWTNGVVLDLLATFAEVLPSAAHLLKAVASRVLLSMTVVFISQAAMMRL